MTKNFPGNIVGIIFFFLCICSCTDKRIEIGGVTNKMQLDSVMALFPVDSLSVDSLPYRTLAIGLRGNMSLFGVHVRSAEFILKKEEPEELSVKYAPSGCLSLLNAIEKEYGLGKFSEGVFTWDIDTRRFELHPMNVKRWSLGTIEPLHLSDTIGFNFTVTYAGNADNEITRLYKETPHRHASYNYSLNTSFFPGVRYNLYINGILLDKEYKYINEMLPQKGEQVLTVEFLPPFTHIREINASLKILIGEGEQVVLIRKEKPDGALKTTITRLVVDADIDKGGTKQSFAFDIPDLPYVLDYINGKDMRNINDIKPLVYAHYQRFKKTLETGKPEDFASLIHSLEKTYSLAYNKSEFDLQRRWSVIESVLDNNEGVDVMDIDALEIEFACEGRLARLVPKRKDGRENFAVKVYIPGNSPLDGAYYVYMDDNDKINFALR